MVFVGHSLTPSRHAEFISASHGIPKQVRNDRKALLLYLASILSAIFAMKTKENAFTLPLVIALYEFLFFKGSLGKRILYLIPLLLTMLIIPLTLIGIDKPVGEIISGVEPATRGYGEISRGDYLLTQFRVIVTYIRLLFLPINQNIGSYIQSRSATDATSRGVL
ncbi:MAG: hypothetical protein HY805_09300 [Nitrospirae bacterium]|nr:hypothetical protein [Nitrospirota bacterium]